MQTCFDHRVTSAMPVLSLKTSGQFVGSVSPCEQMDERIDIQDMNNTFDQERIKGQRRHPPYTPYSIGNSSRVIFRIRIRLPRSLRGCFVEVSHD